MTANQGAVWGKNSECNIALRAHDKELNSWLRKIIKEPIVNEATATSSDPGLRLDLGIRGVWQPQVEALFDVRVIDTDAPSHCHRAPNAILESSSQEKKRMYKKAVKDRRGTFTPFVLSWMDYFTKRLVTSLSTWPLLCLQSGTKHILSPAATSDHGSLLQGFEQ